MKSRWWKIEKKTEIFLSNWENKNVLWKKLVLTKIEYFKIFKSQTYFKFFHPHRFFVEIQFIYSQKTRLVLRSYMMLRSMWQVFYSVNILKEGTEENVKEDEKNWKETKSEKNGAIVSDARDNLIFLP